MLKKSSLLKIIISIFIICASVYAIYPLTKNAYKKYKSYLIKSEIAEILEARRDLRRFYVNDGYINGNAYIAHGGGNGEFTYSNCKEAIETSLRKKFKFIEIDMMVTSDGKIVGAHDWKHFKKITGMSDTTDTALSSDEIKKLKIKQNYTPTFGNDIYKMMLENDFILVTDKIRDYNLLVREIPLTDRIIVEVFSPEDYLKALKTGIKYPAYCIWGLENYKIAKKYNFPIVTMSAHSFFNNNMNIKLVQELHDQGITILLFGTGFKDYDKKDFVQKYLGTTVSKIYTDLLSPVELP